MGSNQRLRSRTFVLKRTTEVVTSLGGDETSLRLELLESRCSIGWYRARIWRLEHFRIQSTFPQDDTGCPRDEPSDELIWKEFESFGSSLEEPRQFDSVDAAEACVLEELEAWADSLQQPRESRPPSAPLRD